MFMLIYVNNCLYMVYVNEEHTVVFSRQTYQIYSKVMFGKTTIESIFEIRINEIIVLSWV